MTNGDEKTVIKNFIEGKISPEDFQNEVVLNDDASKLSRKQRAIYAAVFEGVGR